MRLRNGRPSAPFMRSAIGKLWWCQGASPSSPSPAGACNRAAPCADDNDAAPSLDSSPAKKPLSQERCASENGALEGMISIFGGGVIWFMWKPRPRPACAALRRRGGGRNQERFHPARCDERDMLSAASPPSGVRL